MQKFEHKSGAGFIANIIGIVAVVAVVFLSQHPQFRLVQKQAFAQDAQLANSYWGKVEVWFQTNVWPRVSGEVSKVKDSATQEITQQKNNFAVGLWEKFKNYFAEKFSAFFGTEVK